MGVTLGKIDLIHLKPDLSFQEVKRKSDGNKIELTKNYQPKFEPSSIFTEDMPRWKQILMFWKKPRKIGIVLDGCPSLFKVDFSEKIPALYSDFGTMKDLEQFIDRQVAKSIQKMKAMQTWQVVVVIGLQLFILVLLVISMRGYGFFGA